MKVIVAAQIKDLVEAAASEKKKFSVSFAFYIFFTLFNRLPAIPGLMFGITMA